MYRRFLFIPALFILAYLLFSFNDFKTIAAGIAIFIAGMLSMEKGFKLFTGGMLEGILKRTTKTIPRAMFSGFFATTIVQSSSLVSVIAISFLSAELLGLSQAVGIIFGANLGSTSTAWIVSAFGMKINIAGYAMPMLVFGILFSFFDNRTYKGVGNILVGLGFIFLGISFMKDGFESLQAGIDLSQYAVNGLLGIVLYVCIGAVATVIIQSSGATMALIITAAATGQIDYIHSISLAIGANIGTTVTAILGAITSNENGKRLAVAHLIFNTITACMAVIFIYPLMTVVDVLAEMFHIDSQDISMKLSLFHTTFNLIGIISVSPFIGLLVRILERLFVFKGERRGRPMYLDDEVVKSPEPALNALYNETVHLYDSIKHIIVGALHIDHVDVFSQKEIDEVVRTVQAKSIDINQLYLERVKSLYSAIIGFAVQAEINMEQKQRRKTYKLKLANRNMINALKNVRELDKNIKVYMKGENKYLIAEYNIMRVKITQILRDIDKLRHTPYDSSLIENLEILNKEVKNFDSEEITRLGGLLAGGKISSTMASSLMNDAVFTKEIIRDLLKTALILWAEGGVLHLANVDVNFHKILEE